MIQEQDIERTLDWLVKNAAKAAQSRANRVYLEEYRKTLKAKLMRDSGQESLGAQEREAYAGSEYVNHLSALKTAIEEDEKFRWLMAAAEAKISAWQTMSRMARTQEKVT